MTDTVLPLTKKQKCISNIFTGVMLVAAGLILTLSGTNVIKTSVGEIAAPTVLFALGASLLFSALIARNALTLWLSGVVVACGFTSLLAVVTTADYGNLFPVYIASPGVGCVFAIWFAEAKLPQIKAMLFFGILAALFSLASSGACGWGLTGGLIAAFFGVCVIAVAVESYLKRDKDNNA